MSEPPRKAIDPAPDRDLFQQIAAQLSGWISDTIGAEPVRFYVWDRELAHALPVWSSAGTRDFDGRFDRALTALVDQVLEAGEPRELDPIAKDAVAGAFAPRRLTTLTILPYAAGAEPLGALALFNAPKQRLALNRAALDLLATASLLALQSFSELRYLHVQNRELQRSRENLALLLKEVEQRRLAIEHLTQELEQRAKEQEAVRAIAGAASQSLQIHEMLQSALDKVLEVTERERGTIRLRDPVTGKVVLAVHRGFSPDEVERLLGNSSHPISEQIFSSGQPVVVNDRSELRDAQTLLPQSRSVAWIPIKARQRVVGVLGVSASRPVPFARREVDLLQVVGNVIGVAVENGWLFEESQRQEEIQKLLKELSQDITSLDINALFQKITDKVRRFFKVDISDIRLVGREGVRRPVGASGIDPRRLYKMEGIRGRSGWIVKNRRALVIPDTTKETTIPTGESVRELGLRGYFAVPLFSRSGEVSGILRALTYEPREFSQSEVDLLQQLANGTAIALANAELFEETDRRARELAALGAVTAAVSGSFDIEQILLKGLDAVLEVTEMEGGYVQFLAGDLPELVSKAHRGMSRSFIANFHGKIRPGGKTEQLVATKKPLVLEDISPDQAGRFRDEKITTAAWVPIMSKDRVIGILTIVSRTKRTFPQDKLQLLESIGNALSVALENARLFEETKRRRREAEELARVAQSLTESLDMAAVGERIVTSVRELFDVRASMLRFLQPDGSLRAIAVSGQGFAGGDVLPVGMGLAGRAVAEGRPIWSADVLNDPGTPLTDQMRDYQIQSGNRAMIAVPLRAHERIVGSLGLSDQTGRVYSDGEVALLQTFADQAALALENARLFEETVRRADEQEVLNAIATATSQSLRIDELLQVALDKVLEVTEREQGYIRLKDPITGQITLAAHRGISEAFVETLLHERNRGGKSDQVFESGEPLVINDPEGSILKAQTRREGSRSMSWFPLKVRGATIGIMNVSTTRPIVFQPREVELLKAIGNVIGMALENARLFEKTERNLDRIRALREIDQAITSTLDLGTVLNVLMEKIDLVLPYSAVTLRLFDKETGLLDPVACRNLDEKEWRDSRWRGGRGIANVVFETRKPLIIPNAQSDSRVQDMDFYRKHKLTSYVGVPLVVQENILGVLGFYTKEEHDFSQEEVEFLSTLAEQAAIAIHNSQLYEQARLREAQLQEINRMLSALHAVAAAASQSLDLNRVLRAVIEKITDIFRFDATQIFIYDERMDELRLGAYLEKNSDLFASIQTFRRGQGIVGKVAASGRPLIFEDVATDPFYRQLSLTQRSGALGYHFFAVFPIRGKLKNLGTLACTGLEPRKLNSGEVQLIEAMADQIAVAIENSELYEQVRQKVLELQQKTEELERANKIKDEFLSVMSHELRTPLNVVAGYAGVLREGMLGDTTPKQAEALAKIMNRTNDLFGMITSMLYATSIVADEVRVESHPFALNVFLDELKKQQKARLRENVALDWDYPADLPVIISDRDKLKYVLQTLIDNAVKFTEKGRVTVSARMAWKNGGAASEEAATPFPDGRQLIEFKVADTGIGIPKEKLPIIFEKFRQVDSSETRPYGGVGLGLYIAKNFTELLGGKIDVKTGAGEGSVFTVSIPCSTYGSAKGETNEPSREPAVKERQSS